MSNTVLRTTRRTNSQAITERAVFRNSSGSISSESKLSGVAPNFYGQLDYDYRQSVDSAEYVVYSYTTPIAWLICEDSKPYWVIPDVYYSATTTHHQHAARMGAHYSHYETREI